jgi:hypothetical protein
MPGIKIFRALMLLLLLAGQFVAGAPQASLLGHAVALAAPELPTCPPRPLDPKIKWPPSWCKLPKPTSVATAGLLLGLAVDPNRAVAPEAIATYQVVARNAGRGTAKNIKLVVPYNPELQAVLDTRFSPPGGWVGAVLSDTIELRLGQLGAGAVATATVRLRTLANARLGAGLSVRARAEWMGGRHGTALSNRVALVVARANASEPTVPLAISPEEGSAGTTFDIGYDGFSSSEQVSLWYHQPDGSIVGLREVQADAQGRVAYPLAAANLPSGQFRLVAYGQASQVSAVGIFSIQAP